MKYKQIVFLQGEEADEAFVHLNDHGNEAAVNYLFDRYGGMDEYEIRDKSGAGSSDHEYRTIDRLILNWNSRLGYIGLQQEVKE